MDLSQVTLSQLRYAIAIEDTQNFRQAASRCFVSQSGLSMQVQKLEELLGIVLFDRSKKPVVVTDEGRPALLQMRVVLQETERLGQIVSEEDQPAGRFRLGVIPTLSPTVIPLFLGRFITAYPRVELLIEELKTEEIIVQLQADHLDAGLAATPLAVPGLHETRLGLERMFAYLSSDDPLLDKRQITQAQLRARQLWVMPEGHCFRSQVLSYCAQENELARSPVRFESGSFETLIRLVDGGLGATILPDLVAQRLGSKVRHARIRPLVSPVPVREIGLVTARTDLRRRVSDALCHVITEALEGVLGPVSPRVLVLDPLGNTTQSKGSTRGSAP